MKIEVTRRGLLRGMIATGLVAAVPTPVADAIAIPRTAPAVALLVDSKVDSVLAVLHGRWNGSDTFEGVFEFDDYAQIVRSGVIDDVCLHCVELFGPKSFSIGLPSTGAIPVAAGQSVRLHGVEMKVG